jgi:hypothetical protein
MSNLFARVRVTEMGTVEHFRSGEWERIHLGETIDIGLHRTIWLTSTLATCIDSFGRPIYEVRLFEAGQYKLGPNYGYRITSPEEEADPVLAVARKTGIPVTRVAWSESGYSRVPIGSSVVTDGTVDPATGEVYGFTYLIEAFDKTLKSGDQARFVNRIERTDELEPTDLEEALARMKLGHRPEFIDDGERHDAK